MSCYRLFACHLLFHERPVCIEGLFLAPVTVPSLVGTPSPLSFPLSKCFSIPFGKGLGGLRLTFTHSPPDSRQSLAGCPHDPCTSNCSLSLSHFFPLLPLYLYILLRPGNAWNNCLSMCCSRECLSNLEQGEGPSADRALEEQVGCQNVKQREEMENWKLDTEFKQF